MNTQITLEQLQAIADNLTDQTLINIVSAEVKRLTPDPMEEFDALIGSLGVYGADARRLLDFVRPYLTKKVDTGHRERLYLSMDGEGAFWVHVNPSKGPAASFNLGEVPGTIAKRAVLAMIEEQKEESK